MTTNTRTATGGNIFKLSKPYIYDPFIYVTGKLVSFPAIVANTLFALLNVNQTFSGLNTFTAKTTVTELHNATTFSLTTDSGDIIINVGGNVDLSNGTLSNVFRIIVDSVKANTLNGDLSIVGNGTGVVSVGATGMKFTNVLSGYTASALKTLESSTIFQLTFTNSGGAITGNANFNVTLSRISNVVHCTFPPMVMTTTANGTFTAATTPLPSRFWPIILIDEWPRIINSGTILNNQGLIQVSAIGVVSFYHDMNGGVFSTGANNGILDGFNMTWHATPA